MINESRINALRERKEKADQRLSNELAHSNQNDLRIAELKREKLNIKDEIERLTSN